MCPPNYVRTARKVVKSFFAWEKMAPPSFPRVCLRSISVDGDNARIDEPSQQYWRQIATVVARKIVAV